MMLKLKNYFFFLEAIDFHGHVITHRRLHIATMEIDAVRNLKYPTTTSKQRSFLGLCNLYRLLVPDFL